MFRRRRPLKNEAIHFSFDSFLDLVTNVVGIIIRLILVTWVGARSYHASMQWLEADPEPATKPAPRVSDDPLCSRLEATQRDLDEAKTRLLAQLKELDAIEQTGEQTKAQLALLAERRAELEAQRDKLKGNAAPDGTKIRQATLTTAQVRQRSKKLLEEIKALESAPVSRKQLKYHAPVSQAVHVEELFFECKAGRVTYIDLPSFMAEVKLSMEDIARELRSRYRVERTTPSVGPYRLRYAIERERSALDPGETPSALGFRYGLTEWVVEPLTTQRGETLAQALQPKSEFRQLTDPLDANLTVVTFWVYPDSFEMFRRLRDHLYERGLDIAGRPLPPDAPIAASRHGTASRGQ